MNEQKKENARYKRADAINTIAKCLEMTLRLSKDEYERLTCDEYKRIFGKWTLKELKTLWKLYEDGISGFGAEGRIARLKVNWR